MTMERNWFFRPLRPPPPPGGPGSRDLPVEALRGICALLVFYAHLFSPLRVLDPGYAPSPKFYHFNLGAPAVLMFFVLSGYVIGLTTRRPASGPEIAGYVRRRLIRLLPVTYVALAVTWFILPVFNWRVIAGHLLFLQNELPYPLGAGFFPLLDNNPNLWSLNYEALYYLLFIAVWRWAPAPALVFSAAALLTFAPALGWPVPALVSRWACGSFFWLAGLAVAWLTGEKAEPQRRTNWLSAVLCAYALWEIGPLRAWLIDSESYSLLWLTASSPHRLDFLLVCLWVLLAVTGRAPRAQRFLTAGCLLWAAVGWGRAALERGLGPIECISGGALCLALVTARGKLSLDWCRPLAPLGAISFGLYVLAGPLQLGQRALFPAFAGTVFTYSVRWILVVAGSLAAAWLVERRFHPWLAARLRRAR